MLDICSLELETLKNWCVENGEKPFRATQIFDWMYRKNGASFEEMTNLSRQLRQKLSNAFHFNSLKCIKMQDSEDGETLKFLWEFADQKKVESVLISSGERRTVCVSIQVGCPARCAFCASGKEGLKRNLTPSEVVEQVLYINRFLEKKGERVTHIVFMGMGEPLENYETLVHVIRMLISPDAFGLSQRRITVSTVGLVEGIQKLKEEPFRVNLVLSLHAPNQHIRKKIIPYARRYELHDLLVAMDGYAASTKRDITYEYILIEGINDQPEHAEELSRLLAESQCTVNLIPYNTVEGLRLKRPKKESIEMFRHILEKHQIPTTWRYTKGKDIAAACGQLALQN